MVPKLDDLGFVIGQQGRDPVAGPNQDTYLALFEKNDKSGRGVSIRIYSYPTLDDGAKQYTILAAALQNPPPGFFGGNAKQSDGTPVAGGPERRSYVTGSLDSQGNLIWTDIYRFGRVAAVVQVLEKGDSQQVELRKTVAARIEAKVK